MAEAAITDMTNEDLDILAQRNETHRDLIADAVRLMKKSAIEYDRKRRSIAQQLGCRVSALDAHVKGKVQEDDLGSRHRALPFERRTLPGTPAAEDTKSSTEPSAKPQLMVHTADLPASVRELGILLAQSHNLFDRGVPVRIVNNSAAHPKALPLTKNNVVIEAHRVCQPVKIDKKGDLVPITLPDRAAQMYLDSVGEWDLRPLSGISLAPLLSGDGTLRAAAGYDEPTTLWCYRVPSLELPAHPTRGDAERSLRVLRQTFRTFPFADSVRCLDRDLGMESVDISKDPGRDESAFLVALLTACCRPSLWLAPGLLITAPTISGAGSGKGLLVRAACMIAFGLHPRAFTPGHNRDELEKRLAAEFVEAQPAVFLDNANGVSLRSDTLASVLTERPASVRVLGETRMVQLNSTAFVAVTGNGLSVSEDLARRFIVCELDAHCEDPESRAFAPGFLKDIEARRSELLAAALIVWRWGRQNPSAITNGKPLGSFEEWSEWCRDPLLTLGCCDPVERIQVLKAHDPKRLHVVEVFSAWWENHGNKRVTAGQLGDAVRAVIDPHNRGRQYLARAVAGLSGTNAGGFVLTREAGSGKWSPATYVLNKIEPEKVTRHRDHRGHPVSADPMRPMTSMPHEVTDEEVPPGRKAAV
jgi:hypothetical protein